MIRTAYKHRRVVKRGVPLVKKRSFGTKFLLISLILLGLTVGVLKTLEKDVQASWSPTHGNWLKRQRLNVVNSSPATLHTNTPIAISIDTKTLYDQRKIKPDCSDLRILYQPSDTVYTELPRSLVFPGGGTCSTSTATKVYFNLQTDLTTTSTSTSYYLYYSNPQATTPTNSDNAFDMGAADALLVCPFSGSTTCAAGETPTTATGAIRYSAGASALSFDGKNDYLVSSTTISSTNKFTYEAWVYVKKYTAAIQSILRELAEGDVSLYISSTNKLTCGSTTSWFSAIADTSDISLNAWHHVACSYDGSSIKLFLDGVQLASTSLSSSKDLSGAIIGAWDTAPAGQFNGNIDDIRISNTARYTTNFTPSRTPFVRDEYTKLLYHFDENGDDPRNTGKAIDDSGNGNNGTITGAKYVAGLDGVDTTDSSVIAVNV